MSRVGAPLIPKGHHTPVQTTVDAGSIPARDPVRRRSGREAGDPQGNERLTALTGAVLLVLFAAEGITILSVSRLLYWHYFLGLLLVGPVALKIGSTVYRFGRYYTGHRAYVRKGPPRLLLRILGPFLVLATIAVFGTGILLGVNKHSEILLGFPLLFLHKVAFILWAAIAAVHVLAYVWRVPGLIGADTVGGRSGAPARVAARGRALRWSLVVLALGAGLLLAEWGGHLAGAWQRGGRG